MPSHSVAATTLSSYVSHKLKRVVYSAIADEERLYAGCDDDVVRCFDYSAQAQATLDKRNERSGGFTSAQQRALSAALQASRARQDSTFR